MDPTRTVELLWGLREPWAGGGPKPTLSIEQIARTAVAIADTEGFDAVTMQRVAGELDYTKMALYRYVASKNELIAAMIEAAVGDPPDLTRITGGWRSRLEEWANRMWAAWEAHPWLPDVTVGNRIMGPNEVGWVEAALSALTDTGLNGDEQMDAVRLVSSHTRNTRSADTAGTLPWTADGQLPDSIGEQLHEHRKRYPSVTAAVATANPTTHNTRTFGLHRILDGLEQLISTRSHEGW
ncbi:TetR/AcrR family transcriptional regulator [Nonomuraea sp. LPB2021202275-12-8]|uniref:TetR/AcrR family transcriptional regulator n=1 Tax=Nonomuraea sp. LPB2021202275-12-8 TaxID=3120159 RepID=UPI00300C4CDA